jgi:polysaccharide pyruvyl transferase WcaK-like protein
MKGQKSVLISGYYGVNNVGDDLLLKTIVEKLRMLGGQLLNINITAKSKANLSADILSSVNVIEPPNPNGFKPFRILNTISHELRLFKDNDIYIYGGGTRLFETQNRSYQSLMIKYIILRINKLLYKRKVLHVGVGIGEVYSDKGKWLLKQILILSDLLLLRDKNSYDIARVILGNSDKVLLGADLLFLNSKNAVVKKDTKKFKIGLSFFQYYGYISNEVHKKEGFRQQVVSLIQSLTGKFPDAEINLFSFQKDMGGKDEEFNNQVHASFAGQSNVVHIKYSADTNSIIKQLSMMNLCIGMRFHFCLIALFSNIKTIGINYQPKVKYEFEELGLGDFCFQINELDKIYQLNAEHIDSEDTEMKFNNAFDIINKRSISLNKQIDNILTVFVNTSP